MVLPHYNQLLNMHPSQWYFYASHTAVLQKKPSILLAPNHSLILAYTQLVTNTAHSPGDLDYKEILKSVDNIQTNKCHTVRPEILAGNLFWRIGGFESNPQIIIAIRQTFYGMMSSYVPFSRDVINMWSTVVQNVRTKASNFERMERK